MSSMISVSKFFSKCVVGLVSVSISIWKPLCCIGDGLWVMTVIEHLKHHIRHHKASICDELKPPSVLHCLQNFENDCKIRTNWLDVKVAISMHAFGLWWRHMLRYEIHVCMLRTDSCHGLDMCCAVLYRSIALVPAWVSLCVPSIQVGHHLGKNTEHHDGSTHTSHPTQFQFFSASQPQRQSC